MFLGTFVEFFCLLKDMRTKIHLLFILSLCLLLSSCFKDEPLNAECDIEEAFISSDALEDMFFNVTDARMKVPSDKNEIIFSVRKQTDLTALAPEFLLTEGATIVPESGSVHDFSNGPVEYTVTSQDGAWQRKYLVSFRHVVRSTMTTMNFDFEHYRLNADLKPDETPETAKGKYYVWSDLSEDGVMTDIWATGNPGFKLSKGSATAVEFPTVAVAGGYDGACVKLETKNTGALGAHVKMPLAAGNLFLGNFNVQQALRDAMQATEFGLPFDRKPLRFSGYYKYKAGEKFQNRAGEILPDVTDEGQIYAVLYRNHDDEGNAFVLHGDDVLTSKYIVAIADAGHIGDISDWTRFDVEFAYQTEIDETLLNRRGYNLAVVFTSSKRGASFEGAIGSTLYVDKVEVECAKIEE